MRDSDIPMKTDAGRRELAERRHALHSRQRSLLIAISGEHSLQALRRQFQALGDVDAIVDELCGAGLIEARGANAGNGYAALADASAPPDETVTPVQRARQFMNETAVAALGLRSFLFTLKLEKCYSKAELAALLPEYRRVLGKAKDAEFANAMAQRAETLLANA